jgi:hypothetical protein
MRMLTRSKAVLALTACLVLAGGGLAWADNVQNDVTAGGTDTFAAGSSTTISYRITANNGDGQTGCNAADSTKATVTINAPTGVSASPNSLDFTACGAPQAVVFSSSTPGDYPITVSVSDSGAGTYNTNPASFTLHVGAAPVTNTAPTLTLTNQTFEATGPSGAAASYTASANDAEDGALTPTCTPVSGSTFALGTTTVNCSVTDNDGATTTGSFTVAVVDTAAPRLTLPGNITEEATGPSGAVVNYTASASDVVDGPVSPNCSPTSGSTFGLGTTTVNCSPSDSRGNTGSGSFTITVRDTTPPGITWVGGPADGGSYYFGSVPAEPTCTASDTVSGTVPCAVTGYSGAVGAQTIVATATDGAGNTATQSRSYTVLAWNLGGFYAPVDMNGVWNTVKGGSTVPLKFEVWAGPAGSSEQSGTSAVTSFTQTLVSCPGANAPTDAIETFFTTGGTALRYDATAGQFVQNWATPKKPGSCYRVAMTTQDGSRLIANFILK